MHAFTHKFHVHIIQEHIVDTNRSVSLHDARVLARTASFSQTYVFLYSFISENAQCVLFSQDVFAVPENTAFAQFPPVLPARCAQW